MTPKDKVNNMMARKVDFAALKASPDLYETLARDLATEYERAVNDNDYVYISWAAQVRAQNYFNDNGFEATLAHMLECRAKNDSDYNT